MPTYSYVQLSNFVVDQLWGIQTANIIKNNIRYLAEDILGNPAGNSHMIPALTLDNGATHGGRVFFNGGSSSYIGSDAAGLILELAGFTSATVPAGVANSFYDAVTRSNGTSVGVRGVAISNESSSVNTTSTSYSDLGVTAEIITTGRPVWVGLTCDASVGFIEVYRDSGTSNGIAGGVRLRRDSTDISIHEISVMGPSTSLQAVRPPPGSIYTIDTPSAGTYIYRGAIARRSTYGTGSAIQADNIKVVAFEL